MLDDFVFSPASHLIATTTTTTVTVTAAAAAMAQPYDYICKLVSLGDSGSGKSSVCVPPSPPLSQHSADAKSAACS